MKNYKLKILCVLWCLLFTNFSASAAIYVSQTGAGAANGTTATNAYPLSWLTTSGNWGGGAGQIGPSVMVMLEGSITQQFNILGSGRPGNPITLKFDTGAYMSFATMPNGQCAIGGLRANWIVIDGGGTNNGAIFCTANGYGLANANLCNGISLTNCNDCTIKDLAVTNIYVPSQNQESASSENGGIYFTSIDGSGCTNMLVQGCLLHDEGLGVGVGFGAAFTNIAFVSCNIYHCNWCASGSDLNSSAFLNGLIISNCWFHDWTPWNDPADNNHHNGFYGFTASGGELTNVSCVANSIGGGFGNNNQTAGFYISGNVGGLLCANNVFDSSDGTSCGAALCVLGVNIDSFHYTERVFNNTFLGAGGANNTAVLLGAISDSDFPPENNPLYCLSNNIFLATYTAVGLDFDDGTYTASMDYDDVYGITSGATWMRGASDSLGQNTLAQWQGLGYELHLAQGNPVLGANYQPQAGSTIIRAGVNLSAVFTTDFAGVARSASGPWDIGAVQHAPYPLAIYSPTGPIFSYSQNGPILAQ